MCFIYEWEGMNGKRKGGRESGRERGKRIKSGARVKGTEYVSSLFFRFSFDFCVNVLLYIILWGRERERGYDRG